MLYPMEEDAFDLAIEGTTTRDFIDLETPRRTIVIDTKGNYGSTYPNIDKLKDSPYISDFNISRAQQTNFTIEALPFLLTLKSPSVVKYTKKPFGGNIDYADVKNIFFIDKNGKILKLPISKTEIVNCESLSNTDRYFLYESVKNGSISSFQEYLEKAYADEQNLIYRAFVKYKIFDKNIIENFEGSPYIYPVYGVGEICENISLTNSLKGHLYLLNKNITISESDEKEGYRYKFECEYGRIFAKEFIKQDLRKKIFFVRVMLIQDSKFDGNFIAYLEGDELIKIIGLNSDTKVCGRGQQLLYVIKENSLASLDELAGLLLDDSDILTEISFKTLYDINQF